MNSSPGFGQHTGVLIDERFLSDSVNDELRLHLRDDRRWSKEREAAFLRATSEEASQAAAEGEAPKPGEVKRALAKLAKDAEIMQESLRAVAGESPLFLELQNQWDVLRLRRHHAPDLMEILGLDAHGGEPVMIPEAGDLCEQLWRDLEALRFAAAFATENMIAPQEAKHAAMRAKFFVARVAERYRAIYGCLPEKTKTTWFPAYMKIVGRVVGISCTESITEAAINELQARDSENADK